MVAPVTALLGKIELDELRRWERIDEVVILSLMPSLYTLRVKLAGDEYVVTEQGKGIRRPNAEALRRLLASCRVGQWRMLHSSANDEMIGQPRRQGNELNIRLGDPEPDP